jgi:pyruvate,water dikinase
MTIREGQSIEVDGAPAWSGSGAIDDGFSRVWEQPGDAELTWTWDVSHWPLPFSPLSVDYAEALYAGIERELGLRQHERGRRVYRHGFLYEWRQPKPGHDAGPADPVVEERKRAHEALAARLHDAWQRDFEPAIRRLCHGIRDRDYDAMSAAEIAAMLPDLFVDSGSAFGLTMVVADGMFAAMRPFVDLCEEVFGPSQGEALAGELVGGSANFTTSSEVGIWRLARLAERVPAVRDAILRTPAASLPSALRAVDGSARFLAQLDAYLDLYGWRPEMWVELTLPLWAEDPTPLLRLIRAYLEDPRADSRRARRRAGVRRRQLLGQTRARLAGTPERSQQFEQLYATARAYMPVRENRANWQLTATGVLRRPCMALGRKLCTARRLDRPDDVCYLRLDELRGLVERGIVDADIALDHRALIAERRADRARWLRVVPPLVIGTPDPTAVDDLVAQRGRFASLGLDSGAPGVVRGTGASRGVAHGRARLVRSMAEAHRLGPGEVLVCRTTSPAWTPLIARAAAVVADAGGVLAHCAIVARELAIPCVVGTGVGTDQITDGMLVTVDGIRGLVLVQHADPVAQTRAPAAQSSLLPARAGGVPISGLRAGASAEAVAAPIVWLGDPACHDATLVGGKAANLSRLIARYPVPPGFCITAMACESPAADDGTLPPSLSAQVRAAYAALAERCGFAAPAVAVRSSALDEDGGAASFAGQHQTTLNVLGADPLEQAIVRCWRSLHEERALAYRAQHSLSVEGARLAVLVQQLVPAEAAAVIFTANPVTNRQDEAIVTASYGLGESIVSGSVTPDTYIVRKDGSDGPQIIDRLLGEKAVMTVPVDGGTADAPVPAGLRTVPALQDAHILDAVRLGIALEQEMGWPVDVECAWQGGSLYLLQCRPITTLR